MRWLYAWCALAAALVAVAFWVVAAPGDRAPVEAAAPGGPRAPRGGADGSVPVATPDEVPPGATSVRSTPGEAGRVAPTETSPRTEEGADGADGLVLAGRVIDPAGSPVADAIVYGADAGHWGRAPLDSRSYAKRAWADRREAETDAGGRFELRGLEPGTARIAVRAPGFAPYDDDTLNIPATDGPHPVHDIGDVALALGVALAGNVVDERNFGVAGAELVRLDDSADLFFAAGANRGALLATSGPDGAFRVDTLAPGPWRIMVESPEHPDAIFEGITEHGEENGLLFEVERGASIRGRVLAGASSRGGLIVRASPPGRQRIDSLSGPVPWREVGCGEDGAFVIGGLEPDRTYALRVHSGQDHDPWTIEWLSQPLEVRAGASGVTLELRSTTSARFRAVDQETGAGLTELTAKLKRSRDDGRHERESYDSTDGRCDSDEASGVFTLRELPDWEAGVSVSLSIEKEGYSGATAGPLDAVPGAELDFGTLELKRLRTFAVLVVDAATREPVEGALVELPATTDRPGGDAETDSDGIARLPRNGAVDGQITATAAGYAPASSVPVQLTAAEGLDGKPTHVVDLWRGGTVEAHVLDSLGRPAADVVVLAEYEGEELNQENQKPADREGVVLFSNRAAGPHRLQVLPVQMAGLLSSSWSGEEASEPAPGSVEHVTVTEDGHSVIRLTRPPRGHVTGRITEGGQPLAGAALRVEERDGARFDIPGLTDQPMAQSGGDGRYRIGPLNAGRFELVVRHASRAMDTRVEFGLEEGELALDVDLPITLVEGRVTDTRGRPVAGAVVRVRESRDTTSSHSTISFSIGGDDAILYELGGNPDPQVQTDEDGRYEIRGIAADRELVISVEHDEHRASESDGFEVGPSGLRRGMDLTLEPAGRIEVSVRVRGAPLVDTVVRARFSAPEGSKEQLDDVSSRTDAGGRAVLGGLAPGTWEVQVEPPGWDEDDYPAPTAILVEAGALRPVEFDLP